MIPSLSRYRGATRSRSYHVGNNHNVRVVGECAVDVTVMKRLCLYVSVHDQGFSGKFEKIIIQTARTTKNTRATVSPQVGRRLFPFPSTQATLSLRGDTAKASSYGDELEASAEKIFPAGVATIRRIRASGNCPRRKLQPSVKKVLLAVSPQYAIGVHGEYEILRSARQFFGLWRTARRNAKRTENVQTPSETRLIPDVFKRDLAYDLYISRNI